MRGMVLAGAMGVLLAVSAGAQERTGSRGNGWRGGPGMTVHVPPHAGAWYGAGFGAYWRLDVAGRPYDMRSRGYGAYAQPYASSDWTSESGFVMPPYYSLSRERYQRSWRGYIILPPNFADEDEPAAEAR